jgi:hypothetical protein
VSGQYSFQKYTVKQGKLEVSGQLTVNSTEVFYVQITSCNGAFTLTGTATWLNAFGYLPGDVFMKLPVSFLPEQLNFVTICYWFSCLLLLLYSFYD